MDARRGEAAGVVLIGHSIGGAISLAVLGRPLWAGAHSFKVGDAAFTTQLQAGVEVALVNEGKPIVEAQQAMLGDAVFWASKPRLLAGDAAGSLPTVS